MEDEENTNKVESGINEDSFLKEFSELNEITDESLSEILPISDDFELDLMQKTEITTEKKSQVRGVRMDVFENQLVTSSHGDGHSHRKQQIPLKVLKMNRTERKKYAEKKFEEARNLFSIGMEADPLHGPLYHAFGNMEMVLLIFFNFSNKIKQHAY